MRTREGMKIAKAKGRLRGKVPKPRVKQEAHLVALHKAGEHTSAELAELFGVARSTVYRAIERAAFSAPPDVTRVATPLNIYACSVVTMDPCAIASRQRFH